MINIDSEFSVGLFIDYLMKINRNDQKRMLFMIEATLTMYDNSDYCTDFGTYPNYQHYGLEILLRTDFFTNYHKFLFSISDEVFYLPNDNMRTKWNTVKNQLLKELNFKHSIFDYQYDLYIFGLRLKELRMCRNIPKSDFSLISGLSTKKITQIEDYGFSSKMLDVNQYVVDGLKMSLNLNVK